MANSFKIQKFILEKIKKADLTEEEVFSMMTLPEASWQEIKANGPKRGGTAKRLACILGYEDNPEKFMREIEEFKTHSPLKNKSAKTKTSTPKKEEAQHSPWQACIIAAKERRKLTWKIITAGIGVPLPTMYSWITPSRFSAPPSPEMFDIEKRDKLARILKIDPEEHERLYQESRPLEGLEKLENWILQQDSVTPQQILVKIRAILKEQH